MDIMKDRALFLINNSGENDNFLEEAIGLPRGIIYKWRKEKNKNFKFYLTEIASYFHVSTDYLLGNTDDPSPAGQKEKAPTDGGEPIGPNKRALLDLVEDMSEDEMAALLEIVKATLKMRDKK